MINLRGKVILVGDKNYEGFWRVPKDQKSHQKAGIGDKKGRKTLLYFQPENGCAGYRAILRCGL